MSEGQNYIGVMLAEAAVVNQATTIYYANYEAVHRALVFKCEMAKRAAEKVA